MIDEETYCIICPLIITSQASGINKDYIDENYSPFYMNDPKNPDSTEKITLIERVWRLENYLGIETGTYKTVLDMAGALTQKAKKNQFKRHLYYLKSKKNESGQHNQNKGID